MKVEIYGLEFETDEIATPEQLRGQMGILSATAGCKLRRLGRFHTPEFDLLVNEIIRGRLNVECIEEVYNTADMIANILEKGLSRKDFVVLRSLYYTYEEILELASPMFDIDNFIEEEGFTNIDVESVYGITAMIKKDWYVDYKTVKELGL